MKSFLALLKNFSFFCSSPVQGRYSFVSGFEYECSVLSLCQNIIAPEGEDTFTLKFNYRFGYDFSRVKFMNKVFDVSLKTFDINGNIIESQPIIQIAGK